MRILSYAGVEKLAFQLEEDPRIAEGKSIHQLIDLLDLGFFETPLELDADARRAFLAMDVAKTEFSQIAVLVRKTIGELDVAMARDGRLWLTLVFGPMNKLAELPKSGNRDELLNWIRVHWYSQSTRGLFRDQAISKYWWAYELLSRQGDLAVEDALKLFDGQQDLRTQVMDRTSVNANSRVLGKVLLVLKEELDSGWTYDRTMVRTMFKYLNFDLGRRELDVLSSSKLASVVKQTWSTVKASSGS